MKTNIQKVNLKTQEKARLKVDSLPLINNLISGVKLMSS